MKVHQILLAAIVATSPLTSAIAQGTGPNTKAADTTESTAIKNGSASDPHQSGATGSTVVTGDKSSVAGDRKGTAEQKTGGGGSSGK